MRMRLIPLLVFLFLSLLTLKFSSYLLGPISSFANLFTPPRIYLYSITHAESNPSSFEKLKTENEKLKEQLDALKKENGALSSQFQDTFISSQKLLPAKIIGFKGSLSHPDTFVISQGSKSSIKVGMAVVVGHALLGKVDKTTPFYSEVRLITHKDFSTLGSTSQNNASGIITGEEDFILLDHVVITDVIKKDDTVITKGEQDLHGIGVLPGLIIGTVMQVNKGETQPFQNAIVKSSLDFRKLTTVFVVK